MLLPETSLQYSRRMCGPIKIPELTPTPGNRTRNFMIVRQVLDLTITDTNLILGDYLVADEPKYIYQYLEFRCGNRLFSSPEHFVSYCDRIVVRRSSVRPSVRSQLQKKKKHLLHLN